MPSSSFLCPTCSYPSLTSRGCENPGCIDAYWLTPEERQARIDLESKRIKEQEEIDRLLRIRYGK